MTLDGPTLMAGLSAIGGIVWLVRLEGRVNGHGQEIQQTRQDIAYIRERIDRALEDR